MNNVNHTKNLGILRCSRMVSSSCSNSGTRYSWCEPDYNSWMSKCVQYDQGYNFFTHVYDWWGLACAQQGLTYSSFWSYVYFMVLLHLRLTRISNVSIFDLTMLINNFLISMSFHHLVMCMHVGTVPMYPE